MDSDKPSRFVPRSEVYHRLGIQKSTLRKLIKDGELPEGIYIHATRVVWLESEIEHYMARKIRESGRDQE